MKCVCVHVRVHALTHARTHLQRVSCPWNLMAKDQQSNILDTQVHAHRIASNASDYAFATHEARCWAYDSTVFNWIHYICLDSKTPIHFSIMMLCLRICTSHQGVPVLQTQTRLPIRDRKVTKKFSRKRGNFCRRREGPGDTGRVIGADFFYLPDIRQGTSLPRMTKMSSC